MAEAAFGISGMDGSVGSGVCDMDGVNAIEDGSLITSVLSILFLLWDWYTVNMPTW